MGCAGSGSQRQPSQVPPAGGVGLRDCGRCNGLGTATPNQLTRVGTSFAVWRHKQLTPITGNLSCRQPATSQSTKEVFRALEEYLRSHPLASWGVVLVPQSLGGTPESVHDLQDPIPPVTDLPTWAPVSATQVELPVPSVQVPSTLPAISGAADHRRFVR